MVKINQIKIYFIILITTLSIFFSYVTLFSFPLRFSFILAFPLFFFEKKNFNKQLYLISIIVIFLFFLEATFVNLSENNLGLKSIISNIENKGIFYDFLKRKILELGIIFYLIIFVFYYHNIIRQNLKTIINLFLIIFFLSSVYFFYNNPLFIEVFYTCTTGFFNLSKFIYLENSHFFLISIPVILYILVNLDLYIKSPLYLLLGLYLLIFCILSQTSAYFIIVFLSSILILFLNGNKLSKQNIIIFIFLVLNTIYFFNIKNCESIDSKIYQKCISANKSNCNKNYFGGGLLSPKDKIYDTGIKLLLSNDNQIKDVEENNYMKNYDGKNYPNIVTDDQKGRLNISISVLIYSIINSFESLKKYPLGVGINQYQITHELSFNRYLIENDLYFSKIYDSLALNFLSLNKTGGSLNFSKLLAEFGIFSLVIFFSLIYLSLSKKMTFEEKVFYITLLFIQISFRGTGYFNNGFIFVLIFTLLILVKKNENIKKK